jgi:hypothetical protein
MRRKSRVISFFRIFRRCAVIVARYFMQSLALSVIGFPLQMRLYLQGTNFKRQGENVS